MLKLEQVDYKGLQIEGYYKIVGISYCEAGVRAEDGSKLYHLTVSIEGYTTVTKEHEFERDSHSFMTGIEGLSIENGYTQLKTLPKFISSLDI